MILIYIRNTAKIKYFMKIQSVPPGFTESFITPVSRDNLTLYFFLYRLTGQKTCILVKFIEYNCITV